MTRVGFGASGVSGTQDVDIKTLGGSLVPFGKLPVDATCSTVHATQVGTWDITGTVDISGLVGTLDVDIKTLGGSLVPFGPLPVNATCSTVHATQVGTWDITGTVDISGLTGTLDVDIKTLGGSLVPAAALPVQVTDNVDNLDVIPLYTGITGDEVGIVPLVYDIINNDWREFTSEIPADDLFVDSEIAPVRTMNFNMGFDGSYWDRLRTTDAMAGSTLSTGLLAIGEFGYDGSAWRYKHVDSSGNLIISNTSTLAGISGTLDVDIKTLGGSLVPAGPLPVTGTVDISGLSGTLDVDIKTLGGSLVPAAALPVQVTDNVDNLDVIPMSSAVTTDETGIVPWAWEIDNGKWQAFISGTLADGWTPEDWIIPALLTVPFNMGFRGETMGIGYWDRLRTTEAGDNLTRGILNVGVSGFDGANQDRLRTTSAVSGGTITTGLLGAGIVERNHYCVGLFSSTVFTTSGTLVCSSQYDISKFYTKTICHYVNGATSTIQVYARCCSGDNFGLYYQDTNVTSTQFITISFSEALHDVYACVQVTSTLGTISTSLAMQT